jgi:hypothetical protein
MINDGVPNFDTITSAIVLEAVPWKHNQHAGMAHNKHCHTIDSNAWSVELHNEHVWVFERQAWFTV